MREKLIEIIKKTKSHFHNDTNVTDDMVVEAVADALIPLFQQASVIETCTMCGGLGGVPNHPHVVAHKCPRCNGAGKTERQASLATVQEIANILLEYGWNWDGVQRFKCAKALVGRVAQLCPNKV